MNAFIHYLDDCSRCENSINKPKQMLNVLLAALAEMGVPVSEEKVEGPATCIKFLGLEVETINMLVKIPKDKLTDLRRCISNVLLGLKRR